MSSYESQILINKLNLCILSRNTNNIWIGFLKKIKNYNIYYIIDDETNLDQKNLSYENINVIVINENECISSNYYNSSIASNLKPVVAWDKALYYFNLYLKPNSNLNSSIMPISTEYVWFLEDDVFIMNEEILLQIDEEAGNADLVCAFDEINETGDINKGWNHWVNVIHKIGTPWAHSLISCCRLSKRLLQKVDEYVKDRPLMFIEALFSTLAHHYDYTIYNPEKMKTITYNKKWELEDILKNPNYIYHPVKSMDIQFQARIENADVKLKKQV
jgi:hypothetical protein